MSSIIGRKRGREEFNEDQDERELKDEEEEMMAEPPPKRAKIEDLPDLSPLGMSPVTD